MTTDVPDTPGSVSEKTEVARKTKEEAQETRERLLDAAARTFCEKGVANTSLDDIARAAGVTRGAFYWHFRNKTDLMAALWERKKMPLNETWATCCPAGMKNPLERIRQNAIEMLRRAATDESTRQVYKILFHKCEGAEDGETIMARCLESRKECVPAIHTYFDAAVAAGQLPKDLDVRTAIAGFFSFLDGLIYNSFLHPDVIQLADLAEHYVDVYLEGLKRAPVRKKAAADVS